MGDAPHPPSQHLVQDSALHDSPRHESSYQEPTTLSRRRINVSSIEKLELDVTFRDFCTWRSKWTDFCHLEHLEDHSTIDQISALRMTLSTQMLQTVEMALDIRTDGTETTTSILDKIQKYIRSKRSVAIDWVEFEECQQFLGETFDEFYIRLRQIAGGADLCHGCFDSRVTTRIISGIKESETRRKLLARIPFPSLQEAIIICRTEESASQNGQILGTSSPINRVFNKPVKKIGFRNPSQSPPRSHQSNFGNCGSCGLSHHNEPCPAQGLNFTVQSGTLDVETSLSVFNASCLSQFFCRTRELVFIVLVS